MSEVDHRLGMKLKFAYSLAGLLLGAGCILAGVTLGLAGVVGKTSWTASALGFSTNMTDATPGVIVFVVGIFFVFITRFKVKHIVESPAHKQSVVYHREGSIPQKNDRSPSHASTGGKSSLSYKQDIDR